MARMERNNRRRAELISKKPVFKIFTGQFDQSQRMLLALSRIRGGIDHTDDLVILTVNWGGKAR